MDGNGAADQAFEPVRERIAAEIEAALGEIDQAPGDVAAFHRASWITEAYRQATNAGAGRRTSIANRIRQTGQLSLAKLGDKIGLPKTRTAQIVSPKKRKDKP